MSSKIKLITQKPTWPVNGKRERREHREDKPQLIRYFYGGANLTTNNPLELSSATVILPQISLSYIYLIRNILDRKVFKEAKMKQKQNIKVKGANKISDISTKRALVKVDSDIHFV